MNRIEKRALHEKCGAKRKQNVLRIRAYLLLNGHTEASIAAQQGVSPQAVCNVITGRKHTPSVLDALAAAGVPLKYLADPRQEARHEK